MPIPQTPMPSDSWKQILAAIKPEINPLTYQTWLRPTKLESNGNASLRVRVPTSEFADYIQEHFQPQILKAAANLGINEVIYFAPSPVQVEAPKKPRRTQAEAGIPTTAKAPVIPEKCWRGIFAEYRDIACKASESPDAFHFAGIAAAVSAALGKSIFLKNPVDVWPNVFVCVVGEAGCGKSDPYKLAVLKVLRAAFPDVLILTSLDSSQGLITAIKRRGARAPSVVVSLTEIRSLIEKSAQKASGDLIPKLNDLYDCVPRLEINTKNSFEEVDDPPAGIFLAGTTPEWMDKARREDLTGGTGSRILFFPGDPKMNIRPRHQDFTSAILALKDIGEFWKAQAPAEITFLPDAEEAYWKWHDNRPTLKCSHQLIRAMSVRHRSYFLKFCLIYAAIEKKRQITVEHVAAARELIDNFAFPSLWHLFSDFSLSPFGKLEQKIIQVVKESGSHGIRVKHLLWKFQNGQYDRWMLRRALENVAGRAPDDPSWDGDLRLVTLGRKYYVVMNEDEE